MTSIQSISCSQTDVQNAINSAKDGDIVNIPSGSCTWTSTLNINKPISLIGAGQDITIITDNSPNGYPSGILTVNHNHSNLLTRISGFTLKHALPIGSQDADASIKILGTGSGNMRIDHITIKNIARWLLTYTPKGLIDNVNVINSDILFSGDYTTGWSHPLALGTNDAWFVEDSTFTLSEWVDGLTDAQYGARYVFRHNNVNIPVGSTFAGYPVGNHGYDTSERGCMSMEIYENTFTDSTIDTGWLGSAVQLRGGTGVVFNNKINGNRWQWYIAITNYRSCSDAETGLAGGYCNGSHPEDGNIDHGYPCRDQIGRGGNQELVPLYVWNNTNNGNIVGITQYHGFTGNCNYQELYHIKKGRDYYLIQRPNYTPYLYPHPVRSTECPTPIVSFNLNTT